MYQFFKGYNDDVEYIDVPYRVHRCTLQEYISTDALYKSTSVFYIM